MRRWSNSIFSSRGISSRRRNGIGSAPPTGCGVSPEPEISAWQAKACPTNASCWSAAVGHASACQLAQFQAADDGVGLVFVNQRVVDPEFALLQTSQPVERRGDDEVEEQQLQGLVEQAAFQVGHRPAIGGEAGKVDE